jgi:hypothetical protein
MGMIIPKFSSLFIVLLSLMGLLLNAQVIEDGDTADAPMVLIELFNGQEFIGSIVEQDSRADYYSTGDRGNLHHTHRSN